MELFYLIGLLGCLFDYFTIQKVIKVKIADPAFFIDSHRTTSTEHGE
jgi:hypothetical protein